MTSSMITDQQNEQPSAGRTERRDVRDEITIADEQLADVAGGVTTRCFIKSWSTSGDAD